jgi:hypothetical protein
MSQFCWTHPAREPHAPARCRCLEPSREAAIVMHFFWPTRSAESSSPVTFRCFYIGVSTSSCFRFLFDWACRGCTVGAAQTAHPVLGYRWQAVLLILQSLSRLCRIDFPRSQPNSLFCQLIAVADEPESTVLDQTDAWNVKLVLLAAFKSRALLGF